MESKDARAVITPADRKVTLWVKDEACSRYGTQDQVAGARAPLVGI